jgi:hypothetical protein
MINVLWTALGVGGATVIGALIGFAFKNISHKFSDIVLSFAAGVMLAAAVFGLVLPSPLFQKNTLQLFRRTDGKRRNDEGRGACGQNRTGYLL